MCSWKLRPVEGAQIHLSGNATYRGPTSRCEDSEKFTCRSHDSTRSNLALLHVTHLEVTRRCLRFERAQLGGSAKECLRATSLQWVGSYQPNQEDDRSRHSSRHG
jgi:hypothetical protein